MSFSSALNWAERELKAAGLVATAHLDALVLLEDVTKVDRARILSEPENIIPETLVRQYKRQVAARVKHLPLAYIRGKTEFYGREFIVNKHVLEPRPESEALIEEFKRITSRDQDVDTVIDIGSGSGALIITAKLERPKIDAFAVDISSRTLDVAKRNAALYDQDITFYRGDLLSPIPNQCWSTNNVLVLANLPYVPEDWQINQAATHEPAVAIFGGKDGLRLYRKLFKQHSALTNRPSWVLTESMPPQHPSLTAIAAKAGYEIVTTNDFVQVFKS